MNLVELVGYFRKGGSFESFCKEQSLDLESEVIFVFMLKPYSLDSHLGFFEFEKTKGNVEFVSDGVNYYYLFDFYYFQDAIKESLNESKHNYLSDAELAKRLLLYGIYDA